MRPARLDFIQKPIEAEVSLRSKVNVFCDLYCQRRRDRPQRDELEEAHRQALGKPTGARISSSLSWHMSCRNPVAARCRPDSICGQERRISIRLCRSAEQMERQLELHLSRLVEDLLDISRISEGKISLRKERITARAILRSAIEASRPNLEFGRPCALR